MSTTDSQKKAERQNKVLIVDDDARLRDLLNRYLTENGFSVTVAEDAKAMNKALEKNDADAIQEAGRTMEKHLQKYSDDRDE